MSSLEDRLTAISDMTVDRLRSEWRRVFDDPPPSGYTPSLLRLGLAYKVQDRVHARLPEHIARMIERQARTPADSSSAPPATVLSPGTRLVREWHGESHHVLVINTGYVYRDRQYPSLTSIARKITGAAWSGPRFFGLVSRRGRGDGSADV